MRNGTLPGEGKKKKKKDRKHKKLREGKKITVICNEVDTCNVESHCSAVLYAGLGGDVGPW